MFSYEDAINKITGKNVFYIDLGLDRILSVLDKFGNPQDCVDFIHVAGTNGKGSVCAIIESILREAGYKTGMYTSPHLWEYTERIQVCGQEIPKEKFAEYTEQILNTGIHLTEFEILTVIMFLFFRDEKIDVGILEVGLGGRLDATNVINKNLCSVITQIDYDHTDRLGNTLESIAYEKAGIIKPNCPIITGMGYEVIRDKADECNSMFILVNPSVDKIFADALSLKGRHQIDNLALALTVIQYLYNNIDMKTIIKGLKNVYHPARFQYIESKNLIIDACHNPNGVQALRDNLDMYFPAQKRRFVFGALKRKDFKTMMDILFREDDEIYLNEFNHPESCSYDLLSKTCKYKVLKYENESVLTQDKLNIVCGSFYMIGNMTFLKQ